MALSIGDPDDTPYCSDCGKYHEPEVGFGCPYTDILGRPLNSSSSDPNWVDAGQKQLEDAKAYEEARYRRIREEHEREWDAKVKEWRGGLWFKDLIKKKYHNSLKKLHENVFTPQKSGWTWVSGKARVENNTLIIEREELDGERLNVTMVATKKLSHKIVKSHPAYGVVIRTSQIDDNTFQFKVKYEGKMLPLEFVRDKCEELFKIKEELSKI